MPPSQCHGRFKTADLVPAYKCRRDTCEFNSRLATLGLGFLACCVLWEWVGTLSSASLTLAASQMCLFLPLPRGRPASGRVVKQATSGARLPGVHVPPYCSDLWSQANSLCFHFLFCQMGTRIVRCTQRGREALRRESTGSPVPHTGKAEFALAIHLGNVRWGV